MPELVEVMARVNWWPCNFWWDTSPDLALCMFFLIEALRTVIYIVWPNYQKNSMKQLLNHNCPIYVLMLLGMHVASAFNLNTMQSHCRAKANKDYLQCQRIERHVHHITYSHLSWLHDTFDHQRNEVVWSHQEFANHPPGLARQMPRAPKAKPPCRCRARHETWNAC